MNTTHTQDSVPSVAPFTTNIYAEPIAESGLRSRYQVLGDEPWNDTGRLMVEVLLKLEKATYLAKAAAELGLDHEIVHDANGTRWRILEAQGSREAVEAFVATVEALNIRRAG